MKQPERTLVLVATLVLGVVACDGGDEPQVIERPLFCPGSADLAALVDPMIGTSGSGNALPAALVPHGMVRLGPDTNSGASSVDAYEYRNDRIEGFTHTNLHGPGGSANGYSQILVMPTTGPLETEVEGYSSAFSHDTEEASPGFYAVTLDDTGVRAELTATGHAGFHRYTFPGGAEPSRILMDLGHSLGISEGGSVRVEGDGVIRGYGEYNVHPALDLLLFSSDGVTGQSKVYFHARFDPAFDSQGTWQGGETSEGSREAEGSKIGVWAGYASSSADRVVTVKVGISLVSEDQAQRNLEGELGDLSFDEVRQRARDQWNCHLNRVEVDGGTEAERTMFYTALYHTLFQPADYTEVGGHFFSGADGVGEVFRWTEQRFYTDDWCAWDTYRTSRPLATLVEADRVSDVVASYLHLYQQGGWLPKCTWHATGYSRVMIGNHSIPIISDAYVKGLVDQELTELAWEAMERTATEDNSHELPYVLCGYLDLGTPPDYRDLGYVAHECDSHQSASMTLELAYNDWSMAQAARVMGREADAERFLERSGNWRNHWDDETGFMRGRLLDGSWVEPFEPTDTSDANDFCEASSWIYTWFVPHDVPALIDLMGGHELFVERLDQFFDEGHFDPSNEPSFHIPFLYNFAGAPERTQEVVREVLATAFSEEPSGLPGNDDAGATSAWFVFAAMGLYPVAPGDGIYHLGSPLFDRVTIHLDPGIFTNLSPEVEGSFTIEAPGNGPTSIYVQSVELDGESLDRWWITHDEIVAGGTLNLEMGATP